MELLDQGLPNGIIWKASEKAILGLIRDTADRTELLKELLAAEVNNPDRSTHRCAEMAAEIRQTEAADFAVDRESGSGDGDGGEVAAASDRRPRAMERSWCPVGVKAGVPDAEPELRYYLIGHSVDSATAYVNTARRDGR